MKKKYSHNMKNSLMKLPIEVVDIILEFSGIIINRYGKYMNRILKHDERYKLWNIIPKIRKHLDLLNCYYVRYVGGAYRISKHILGASLQTVAINCRTGQILVCEQ
jgi:hypothetical protein